MPPVETVFVVLAPGDKAFARHDWKAFKGKLEPLYCGGDSRQIFSEESFPDAMLRVLRDEAGVKVYIITHIASGEYTADKFEREMQRNVDTMIRALVTEA